MKKYHFTFIIGFVFYFLSESLALSRTVQIGDIVAYEINGVRKHGKILKIELDTHLLQVSYRKGGDQVTQTVRLDEISLPQDFSHETGRPSWLISNDEVKNLEQRLLDTYDSIPLGKSNVSNAVEFLKRLPTFNYFDTYRKYHRLQGWASTLNSSENRQFWTHHYTQFLGELKKFVSLPRVGTNSEIEFEKIQINKKNSFLSKACESFRVDSTQSELKLENSPNLPKEDYVTYLVTFKEYELKMRSQNLSIEDIPAQYQYPSGPFHFQAEILKPLRTFRKLLSQMDVSALQQELFLKCQNLARQQSQAATTLELDYPDPSLPGNELDKNQLIAAMWGKAKETLCNESILKRMTGSNSIAGIEYNDLIVPNLFNRLSIQNSFFNKSPYHQRPEKLTKMEYVEIIQINFYESRKSKSFKELQKEYDELLKGTKYQIRSTEYPIERSNDA